uniref:Aspartate aminotransferase n=1 Tax=Schistocephalus solidus TaxID=70667 RepID=A0A0X3PU09_SCHSO
MPSTRSKSGLTSGGPLNSNGLTIYSQSRTVREKRPCTLFNTIYCMFYKHPTLFISVGLYDNINLASICRHQLRWCTHRLVTERVNKAACNACSSQRPYKCERAP